MHQLGSCTCAATCTALYLEPRRNNRTPSVDSLNAQFGQRGALLCGQVLQRGTVNNQLNGLLCVPAAVKAMLLQATLSSALSVASLGVYRFQVFLFGCGVRLRESGSGTWRVCKPWNWQRSSNSATATRAWCIACYLQNMQSCKCQLLMSSVECP
eukprot:6455037-Amphidinium_carterae.1